jgi:uncharacterized protein (TIGR02466 family)
MNNIIYPFPLPVYQDFIDKENFELIKKDTYNFISKNKKLFEQPWISPTFTTCYHSKDINIKSNILESQIKFKINQYFKEWEFFELYNLEIDKIWVNIAKKGSYQEEHNHSISLFSGVLYIEVNKDSGNFQFINPLSAEQILTPNSNKFKNDYTIYPSNGMIIIFPGWLNHRVLPNNSNEDRISISFNITKIN